MTKGSPSSRLAPVRASLLVARCVEEAGADLIVVYNSGYFRLNGLPSFVGNLPVGDANALMLELGHRSIIPATRSIPVIGGVYGSDPTRRIGTVLDEMVKVGYTGVINFPTVGRIDGQFRQELEAAGCGFEREVDLISMARSRDLFSLAYVFTPSEAAQMTEAGADVIVGHVGRTSGGDVGSQFAPALEEAINRLREIFFAARQVRDDVLLLSHGGPIITAKDAEFVNIRTGAAGFVAASSIERIPVEAALKNACREFKAIRATPEQETDRPTAPAKSTV